MNVIAFGFVIVALIFVFLFAANPVDAGIVVHACIFAAAAIATAFALIWRISEVYPATPSGPDDIIYNDVIVRYGLMAHATRALALIATGCGAYRADADLPLPGQWDLRIVVKRRDGPPYLIERRLWLAPSADG